MPSRSCGLVIINGQFPDRLCHGPAKSEKKAQVSPRLITCRKQWERVAVTQSPCFKVADTEGENNSGVSSNSRLHRH